jgi:rod shape determining protein RodA
MSKVLRRLDYTLLLSYILLSCYGLIIIYSASKIMATRVYGDPLYFVKEQMMWILVGLVALMIMILIDYRFLGNYANLIYVGVILLLIFVFIIGNITRGAQRWINLKVFRLQPAEVAKIAIIIALAKFLGKRLSKLDGVFDTAISCFIVMIPLLLILKQPDLGTALVLVAILIGMLYMSGIPIFHLICLVGLGAIIVLLLWPRLEAYQQRRMLVFLYPDLDPLGASYQLIQSKIAIGSGGLWGKGLFAGTQSQLSFLPDQHTDFIFAVVGEELGFMGGVALLFLYVVILWRGLIIAEQAKDGLGGILAIGVVSMLFFQIFVNVGMTMGIMPITGMPLPFITYGGNSFLVFSMAIGLLENVYLRKQDTMFD